MFFVYSYLYSYIAIATHCVNFDGENVDQNYTIKICPSYMVVCRSDPTDQIFICQYFSLSKFALASYVVIYTS